jgi:hypothetical protein
LKTKYTAEKITFGSKTTIYLSLGLYNGFPSYRRSLQPSAFKREHPALQNMKFFLLLRVIFALLNPDPGSDSGSTDLTESGSETLLNTFFPPIPCQRLKFQTKSKKKITDYVFLYFYTKL